MSHSIDGGYAGDVDPEGAWTALVSDRDAVLVDVRTRAEWSFVGLPMLDSLGKKPVALEWLVFPSMSVDPGFLDKLDGILTDMGATKETSLYFLCRSGHRSRQAAAAATRAGWSRCHNILGGFEGSLDGDGHRGRIEGWKASGLPWIQT